MERKKIKSGSPFEEKIGFSRAIRIENHIFVSGTAPIAKNGDTKAKGDPYEQTKRCIEIIQESIEKAGGKLDDVVRTRIYLTDIKNWGESARAHKEFFQNIKPASTYVEVSGFINPDWLVEVEAECFVS